MEGQTAKQTSIAPVPPKASVIPTSPLTINPIQALFQSPIVFYGVVLDQYGRPVSAASVKASVVDNMLKGPPLSALTDQEGKFTLHSKGMSIHIEVSKDGYYYVDRGSDLNPSSQGFDFGTDTGRGIHRSDPAAPTIFHLRRAGKPVKLERIVAQTKVPRDGSPIVVGLIKSGTASLRIRCTTKDQNDVPNAPFDWRCEIDVVGGGIQEAKDENSFIAPDGGYGVSATIDMPKSLSPLHWRKAETKNYWIRFPDSTFAKIQFRMNARGDHFATINGFRNPSPNDQNLEPKLDAR